MNQDSFARRRPRRLRPRQRPSMASPQNHRGVATGVAVEVRGARRRSTRAAAPGGARTRRADRPGSGGARRQASGARRRRRRSGSPPFGAAERRRLPASPPGRRRRSPKAPKRRCAPAEALPASLRVSGTLARRTPASAPKRRCPRPRAAAADRPPSILEAAASAAPHRARFARRGAAEPRRRSTFRVAETLRDAREASARERNPTATTIRSRTTSSGV